MSRIKIGMAFAGGGVRGSAHLGIVKAMRENGIYPEIYAGASAGAVVASLLAKGYEPDEALEKFSLANKKMIDIAYGHIFNGMLTRKKIQGFVKGDKLESVLDKMFDGGKMSEIEAPLAIITTDIDGGRQIVWSNQFQGVDLLAVNDDNFQWMLGHHTSTSEILRASCGLPPAFIPKQVLNLKLIDGGITNNLPSDVVKAMGADKVISVDLGYAGQVKTDGFVDVAHMAVNLLMERVTDGNSKDYGLYLNPKIYDVTALDTSQLENCYKRGYVYGLSQIDNIVKSLEG